MCYYSVTLKASSYRNERKGEDLTIRGDGPPGRASHHYPTGEDGKIVCVAHGSTAHFEKLELEPLHEHSLLRNIPWLKDFIGKPVSVRMSPAAQGYSADYFDFGLTNEGHRHLAIIYVKQGTKFYTGEKRKPSLETTLGMDDPSFVLDHRPATVEEPGVMRTIGRVLGVCSIIR